MTTDIQAAYQKALEEYHAKKENREADKQSPKKRGRPRKTDKVDNGEISKD